MKGKGWLGLALFLLLWWGAACGSGTPVSGAGTPSLTPSLPPLTPYLTPTPSLTPTPLTEVLLPTSTAPTPTPFVHRIQEGDTLLGIALQYGVSVEDLQKANPALNPNLMPIGATVVIPLSKENPAGLPTPTPIPLPLSLPFCYPQADGGAWCLVAVHNPLGEPVEALGGRLVWRAGEVELESLLNVLPAGEQGVLLAYVPTWPVDGVPRPFVTTALALEPQQFRERYVEVTVALRRVSPPQGRVVHLEGELEWPAGQTPHEVWLLALGYDAQGRPVAARRWTFATAQAKATRQPFQVTLYALGPPIAEVRLQAEGHR